MLQPLIDVNAQLIAILGPENREALNAEFAAFSAGQVRYIGYRATAIANDSKTSGQDVAILRRMFPTPEITIEEWNRIPLQDKLALASYMMRWL